MTAPVKLYFFLILTFHDNEYQDEHNKCLLNLYFLVFVVMECHIGKFTQNSSFKWIHIKIVMNRPRWPVHYCPLWSGPVIIHHLSSTQRCLGTRSGTSEGTQKPTMHTQTFLHPSIIGPEIQSCWNENTQQIFNQTSEFWPFDNLNNLDIFRQCRQCRLCKLCRLCRLCRHRHEICQIFYTSLFP